MSKESKARYERDMVHIENNVINFSKQDFTYDEIAKILNEKGYKTEKGLDFTKSQVYKIMDKYGYSRKAKGWKHKPKEEQAGQETDKPELTLEDLKAVREEIQANEKSPDEVLKEWDEEERQAESQVEQEDQVEEIPLTTALIETFISSGNEFPIEFEKAWKWIGYSRKGNAKEVLVNNFLRNVDYIISLETQEKSAGRPSEEIYLTNDCFENFCMAAHTDKGKDVRNFFVKCKKELQRIQAEQKKAVTTSQMFKIQADINLEFEEKISQINANLGKVQEIVGGIVMEKQEAARRLHQLERSNMLPLEETTWIKIRKIVDHYVNVTQVSHREVWNTLYSELLYRYSRNIKERARKQGKSNKDVIQELGLMEPLFAIASEKLLTEVEA